MIWKIRDGITILQNIMETYHPQHIITEVKCYQGLNRFTKPRSNSLQQVSMLTLKGTTPNLDI